MYDMLLKYKIFNCISRHANIKCYKNGSGILRYGILHQQEQRIPTSHKDFTG
jgi:hypothetical protein